MGKVIQHTLRMVSLFFVFTAFFGSCNKAKLNKETGTSEAQLRGVQLVSTTFFVAREAFEISHAAKSSSSTRDGSDSSRYFIPDCIDVALQIDETNNAFSAESSGDPEVILLDFGSSCTLLNHQNAAGELKLVYDGNFGVQNTSVLIQYEQFVWKGYLISGEIKLTYMGLKPESKRPYYEVVATDISFEPVDNPMDDFTWSHIGEMEHIEGWESTIENIGVYAQTDDKISISGQSSGVSSQSIQFSAEFMQNVHIQPNSRSFAQGDVNIAPNELKYRNLVFSPSRVYVVYTDNTQKDLSY